MGLVNYFTCSGLIIRQNT